MPSTHATAWAAAMTSPTVADRLERLARDIRYFTVDERTALIKESAARLKLLEGVTPAEVADIVREFRARRARGDSSQSVTGRPA